MLGQDSTGQKITFIVIGLLLAALALAILTAWYYRVTDPGPKRSRQARGSEEFPGGGSPNEPPTDPHSGPGWRKRLSGFSVPEENVTTAKEAKVAKRAQKAQAKAQSRAEAAQAKIDAAAAQSATPGVSVETRADSASAVSQSGGGYLPEQPIANVEGGYYLDLTEVPRSDEPQTNVGSLNSLDLRQPAPLLDPSETPIPASTPASPVNQEVQTVRAQPVSHPTPLPGESGLSFDEWLAEAEAIDDH